MNFWALLGLINGLAASIFGLFVYLKNTKNPPNKLWAIFGSTVAFWSYSYFLWQISTDKIHALFWCRALMVGAIFIPVTFLHFLLVWLGLSQTKRKVLFISYGISFVTLVFDFTPFFVKDVSPILSFKYWPQAGVAYLPFLIFWAWLVIYCWNIMFQEMRSSSPIRRNQIKYVLLGAIIGFGGGFTNYPLWFGIKILPYGNILVPIYAGLMSYAIVKHRLMDINVAITKGSVFAVVYAFVLGIPVAVWFWGRTYLFDKIGVNWGLVPIGMALILASLGPAIYGFIRRKTEAALFKERQRYQENLIVLAKQMTLTKDLRQLLVLIIRRVTKEIGISHARIYLLDRKANEYMREVRYGRERRKQFGDSLSKDAPLIQMLYRSRDIGPLLREEVISHFETSDPEYLEEVKAQLRSMGASLLLPAFIGEELVAFLALGTKRSREIYTPDDLVMFKILAGQSALAIENAQFYQQLKESQAAMLQAAKLSSIGELAAGFAHQIDNPLAIISAGCQLCVYIIKKDLGEENLSENGRKSLEEIKDNLGKVIETAHRAADLVQRIKGYAKPSDRDFEATDLNSVMEDVLILAQYQIFQGGINVTKDIPQDLPKVKGIGVQLEQVFLNIIINDCEAMVGKKGELTISARVAKENPDRLEIAISDNGRGIPKENLKKMFDLFFTTKGSQGTGVGLSMAYQIIKDHNGNIDVESEVGKGTKFTIFLPIWEEKP